MRLPFFRANTAHPDGSQNRRGVHVQLNDKTDNQTTVNFQREQFAVKATDTFLSVFRSFRPLPSHQPHESP
jgi:hypothetical protein